MMQNAGVVAASASPEQLQLFQVLFAHEGLPCHPCGDGLHALGLIRLLEPRLVVLEGALPGESGYRIARVLDDDHRRGVYRRRIPVILLADGLRTDGWEGAEPLRRYCRADVVVDRPFGIEELLDHARNLLGRAAPGDAGSGGEPAERAVLRTPPQPPGLRVAGERWAAGSPVTP